jgi:hypothetical protein
MTSIRSLTKLALCAVFALGFLCTAQAEEKKADATGTWTWTRAGRNGGAEAKLTLKLTVEGDKLTGKLTTPGRQGGEPITTEIKDGKVKGDEISFSVTREFNGNSRTSKYNGKVTEDAIKGKIETERNGETQSLDWEAKRETEKK